MQTYVRRQLETGGVGVIPVDMCCGYEEQDPGGEAVSAIGALASKVDGLKSTLSERFATVDVMASKVNGLEITISERFEALERSLQLLHPREGAEGETP